MQLDADGLPPLKGRHLPPVGDLGPVESILPSSITSLSERAKNMRALSSLSPPQGVWGLCFSYRLGELVSRILLRPWPLSVPRKKSCSSLSLGCTVRHLANHRARFKTATPGTGYRGRLGGATLLALLRRGRPRLPKVAFTCGIRVQ